MSARQTSAAQIGFIDAIARRVVELLEGSGSRSADLNAAVANESCRTVAQIAVRYRVSCSCVYAHQGALANAPGTRTARATAVPRRGLRQRDRRQAPPAPKNPSRLRPSHGLR